MLESKPLEADPDTGLDRAGRALATDPVTAEALASEWLNTHPDDAPALLIRAAAWTSLGQASRSLPVLRQLVRVYDDWPVARYQLGVALYRTGHVAAALTELLTAQQRNATIPGLTRTVAEVQLALGSPIEAAQSFTEYLTKPAAEPWMVEARQALDHGEWREAEAILRAQQKAHPDDVLALLMLGELAQNLERWEDGRLLYLEVIDLVPQNELARCGLASCLQRLGQREAAATLVDGILAANPDHYLALGIKGTLLSQSGEFQQSRNCYRRLVDRFPDDPGVWLGLGNMQRALGDIDQAIQSYRRCIALRPASGEAYWSLANLKQYRFSHTESAAIRAALDHADLRPDARVLLLFALAKAEEDAGRDAQAFERYREANELWRGDYVTELPRYRSYVGRCRKLFTRGFFAARDGVGSQARDPVFVVGMPRSGSTLVEQILSSHPLIEGTMELVDVLQIVDRIGGPNAAGGAEPYPHSLLELSRPDWQRLGEEYLERTRAYRKTVRPMFVDKLPNNFLHTGTIHLLLPNARIVDVRRHPIACCWSNFKQHFARGQLFSYDLADLGGYYRLYVELMAHFDRVLPGRVYRVFYEQLIADPESQIRQLLDYCGVPFAAACLRAHETERAVWTPSSEQVRQPIYRTGTDDWRRFEAWLEPLQSALGDIVAAYPGIPESVS
jgi:tetratricopeptide (TPR) repeat protein